jgi:hypothetical protein
MSEPFAPYSAERTPQNRITTSPQPSSPPAENPTLNVTLRAVIQLHPLPSQPTRRNSSHPHPIVVRACRKCARRSSRNLDALLPNTYLPHRCAWPRCHPDYDRVIDTNTRPDRYRIPVPQRRSPPCDLSTTGHLTIISHRQSGPSCTPITNYADPYHMKKKCLSIPSDDRHIARPRVTPNLFSCIYVPNGLIALAYQDRALPSTVARERPPTHLY